MFRDLKEYQEIAKIYAEKVSKPENLEENQANRMKMKQQRTAQNKGRFEKQIAPLKPKPIQGRISPSSQNMAGKPKPMPTTAEIRAKDAASGGTGMSNIPSKEGNAVIDGKKLNPDFGKKVDIKKEFPDKVDPKPLTKKEKFDKKFIRDPKTKTLKRRGSPTAQRAENKEKAKLRAQAMAKARIEAKKKAEMTKEEFTPYDIVLEYLLSTEQAATIEEANYVMTEMDSQTIQSVVKEFMGGKPGDGYIGHPRLNIKNPLNPPKKETKKTTGKGSEKGVQGLGNRATEIEDMIKGM